MFLLGTGEFFDSILVDTCSCCTFKSADHVKCEYSVPFPPGYGASVHFQFPGKDFIPLGTLTNERPSSIYKLRPFQPSSADSDPALTTGTLGIQVIPLEQVQALATSLRSTPSSVDPSTGSSEPGALVKPSANADVGVVAEKVVRNVCIHIFKLPSWGIYDLSKRARGLSC